MRTRILLVEAERGVSAAVERCLSPARYVVRQVADAAGARTTLAELSPPDLVVVDLDLAGGDGLVLCRDLKAARPWLPVVGLSARPSPRARAEACSAGADCVVPKPLEPAELEAAVLRLLAARRARHSA